jgi:uncharacterized protein with GYD domain
VTRGFPQVSIFTAARFRVFPDFRLTTDSGKCCGSFGWEIIVNTYVILLQRMERLSNRAKVLPLESDAIGRVAEPVGVHIFDIVVTLGEFDAVLVLAAPDNAAVAKFVDGLEGWRTVALLATSHSRYKLSNTSHRESRTAV